MSQDEFRAPAGWYPDPLGHPQLRWWNSYGWTEQVSAAPEPITMKQEPQQPRYAWKEEEPTVIPVQPQSTFTPAPPAAPLAPTLHEIEGPRAQQQPFNNWQAMQVPPTAPAAPVQPAAPALPPAPAAQTPPPPYWDDDEVGRPTPSVRPEDLKFWSGPNPAELRRQNRGQA